MCKGTGNELNFFEILNRVVTRVLTLFIAKRSFIRMLIPFDRSDRFDREQDDAPK